MSRKNTRKVNFFKALLFPEEDHIKGPFNTKKELRKIFLNP